MRSALPQERVGGYLRALAAGLDLLGPNEDHVPLAQSLAHLHALSPELSGPLLAPAELGSSGMPSFTWLTRVNAERVLALQGADSSDTSQDEIRRALALEPELGARIAGRVALHRFLRGQEVLPTRRVRAVVRRRRPTLDLRLYFDHLAPGGAWMRTVVDFEGAPGARLGPLSLGADAKVSVEAGVLELMMRHASVPLPGLHAQLEQSIGAVTRLSRGSVGPFWFPGVRLPQGVPAELGAGLLLHLSVDVLAQDIGRSQSQDPLHPEPGDAPQGMQRYRGRQLAASPPVLAQARAWGQERGVKVLIKELV